MNHGHKRFGTYILGPSYPRSVEQSVASDGRAVLATCAGFTDTGEDRGFGFRISDNVDFDNVFVGQYDVGDLQYANHLSVRNNNLMYWKTTKNFHDGCSAHLSGGFFADGNVRLLCGVSQLRSPLHPLTLCWPSSYSWSHRTRFLLCRV